jgi:chromosome segregation ATPase
MQGEEGRARYPPSVVDPGFPRALRGYEPAAVQARLDELAAASERLVTDWNNARASFEAMRAERDALEAELHEVQRVLDELRVAHEALREEAADTESRLAAVLPQRDRLAAEASELRVLLQMRTAERDRLHDAIATRADGSAAAGASRSTN